MATLRKLSNYNGALEAATKYDGTLWRDLPISDQTDPTGASSPDFISLTRGGFTFSFQGFDGGSTVEYKTYRVELDHWADLSKGLEVHFRGTPTTDATGGVVMSIEYYLQKKAGNAITGTSVNVTKSIVAGGNTAGTEYYFSFPLTTASTGLSTMAVGDELIVNIKRLPTDGADTYGADFAFLEFGVHAAVGSNGEAL